MADAEPFPGVLDFFARGINLGVPLYIVSHKTRNPVIGPAYDLHQTARDWLAAQGFFSKIGLPPDHVFFGATRQEKIEHIRTAQCTLFIDDLKETFLEPTFPQSVTKILFSPSHRADFAGRPDLPVTDPSLPGVRRAASWPQISAYVFTAAK
jgi:hypothetical protein